MLIFIFNALFLVSSNKEEVTHSAKRKLITEKPAQQSQKLKKGTNLTQNKEFSCLKRFKTLILYLRN